MKILHTALADDESFLRRFRAEARAAAALSHPNILAIFDWNGDEVPPYIVTEYLGGGSLRSMLDAGRRLSPSQALLVGLETAHALDHAHRQGFVHRDIKPANLLFATDARLRIADFGLARAIAEAGWTEPTGAVLGTARYASPEQARGEPLDGRSDVYSLALLMVESVTGSVPFTADTTIGTLMARLDRPIEVPEALGALAPVIERAGALDPADRPDAADLGRALVEAATLLPRPAPLELAGARSTPGGGTAGEDDNDRTMLHGRPSEGADANGQSPGGSDGDTATVVHRTSTSTATALAQIPDSTARMGHHPEHPSSPGQQAPLPPAPRLAPTARAARLRTWTIRIAAAVIAIALGVAGALFVQQSRVPTHTVPTNLVGLQKSEVTDHVGGFGWRIRQEEEHRDGTQAGVVLDTRPKPGSELREGGTLTLVVSLGPALVDVPPAATIAGLSQDEAASVLGAPGLELVPEFVPTESDEVDRGKVVGFADGTPAQLPKGATVKVELSSGRPGPKIPDMEGWDYARARRELERRGLQVEVETEENDDLATGKVIRSDPEFGDHAEQGGTVTLVLSLGDGPIKVPDVTRESVEQARSDIEALGLSVGTVHGSAQGEVFATTPLPGQEVNAGTSVDLWTWGF